MSDRNGWGEIPDGVPAKGPIYSEPARGDGATYVEPVPVTHLREARRFYRLALALLAVGVLVASLAAYFAWCGTQIDYEALHRAYHEGR